MDQDAPGAVHPFICGYFGSQNVLIRVFKFYATNDKANYGKLWFLFFVMIFCESLVYPSMS